MSSRYARRTVVMGTARSEWVCGAGAIRDFFAASSPTSGAAGKRLNEIASGPFVVVTDANVDRLHGLQLPPDLPRIVLPPGESSKTFASLTHVLHAMLEAGLDRAGTVVAFGGGVVGDLAGFAAATFMRGVRWVNVPTTLLAMVDASIGGKTAVDVDGAKNLAGAFHPPASIVADPLVLQTLPGEQRAAGMAEAIKQAVVGSPSLFERLQTGMFDDEHDVAIAAKVKIDVVKRDPFERGERAVLNLGHTIGHGIEAASRYAVTHGQAVAIGLIAEARLAERTGLATSGVADRIAAVVGRFGLPASADLSWRDVREAMSFDKKRRGRRLTFALPRAVGDVVYGVEVDEGVLAGVLAEVCVEGERRVDGMR